MAFLYQSEVERSSAPDYTFQEESMLEGSIDIMVARHILVWDRGCSIGRVVVLWVVVAARPRRRMSVIVSLFCVIDTHFRLRIRFRLSSDETFRWRWRSKADDGAEKCRVLSTLHSSTLIMTSFIHHSASLLYIPFTLTHRLSTENPTKATDQPTSDHITNHVTFADSVLLSFISTSGVFLTRPCW